MSAPAWLTVGAPVVVFTPARVGPGASMRPTTVEKIGKRDVVCANGFRCNVDRLSKSNGTWDSDTYLLPPDDPRIAAARHENRRRRLVVEVTDAWDTFRRSRSAKDGRDLISAVEALIAQNETAAS